jgi:hypothetical protein
MKACAENVAKLARRIDFVLQKNKSTPWFKRHQHLDYLVSSIESYSSFIYYMNNTQCNENHLLQVKQFEKEIQDFEDKTLFYKEEPNNLVCYGTKGYFEEVDTVLKKLSDKMTFVGAYFILVDILRKAIKRATSCDMICDRFQCHECVVDFETNLLEYVFDVNLKLKKFKTFKTQSLLYMFNVNMKLN